MRRLLLIAAVVAVGACDGRDDDEFEETVYDAQNPPVIRPATPPAAPSARDSLTTRFDAMSDSLRLDSLRRDSLHRDSLRRGFIRRDTTP